MRNIEIDWDGGQVKVEQDRWKNVLVNAATIVLTVAFIGGIWLFAKVLVSSGTFKPEFAQDASNFLESSLIDTRCAYQEHDNRHFLKCKRHEKDKDKDKLVNDWRASNGLWEVVHHKKLREPHIYVPSQARESSFASDRSRKELHSQQLANATYRVKAVDTKASYLASYLDSKYVLQGAAQGVDQLTIDKKFSRSVFDFSTIEEENKESQGDRSQKIREGLKK